MTQKKKSKYSATHHEQAFRLYRSLRSLNEVSKQIGMPHRSTLSRWSKAYECPWDCPWHNWDELSEQIRDDAVSQTRMYSERTSRQEDKTQQQVQQMQHNLEDAHELDLSRNEDNRNEIDHAPNTWEELVSDEVYRLRILRSVEANSLRALKAMWESIPKDEEGNFQFSAPVSPKEFVEFQERILKINMRIWEHQQILSAARSEDAAKTEEMEMLEKIGEAVSREYWESLDREGRMKYIRITREVTQKFREEELQDTD